MQYGLIRMFILHINSVNELIPWTGSIWVFICFNSMIWGTSDKGQSTQKWQGGLADNCDEKMWMQDRFVAKPPCALRKTKICIFPGRNILGSVWISLLQEVVCGLYVFVSIFSCTSVLFYFIVAKNTALFNIFVLFLILDATLKNQSKPYCEIFFKKIIILQHAYYRIQVLRLI